MRKFFKTTTFFFIPYLIFVLVLLILIFTYQKAELHLMLTAHHTPFWDVFFNIITRIGGGTPFIVVALLLFYRTGASLYFLIVQLVNVLLTNSLKLIFAHPRPMAYFHDNFPDTVLHQIAGIRMYFANGFPSGHTSSTFALMLCIALLSKNKYVAFFSCILAILVGYSRIYLSQHFAEDVVFGSFVGVVSAAVLYPFYLKMSQRHKWPNASIIAVLKQKNLSENEEEANI